VGRSGLAWCAVAASVLVGAPASAQDALRGKRLYLDAGRLTGSGVSCVDCHAGYPPGLFGIGRAAGRPDVVEQAVASVPAMTPLRGRLDTEDVVDVAAYLGDPAVPSPALVLTGPDGAPIAGALSFGELAVGTRVARTVIVENRGQLAMVLLGGPVVDGQDAAAFTLRDRTCAAGQSLAAGAACQLELELVADGAPGRRVARVFLEHDWVQGLAGLALIGEVAAVAPPDTPPPSDEPEGDDGGCAVGGGAGPVAALLGIALVLARGWRRALLG
jgi:hypothetical protein